MELITVGKIGGTHHLKGALKFHSNVGDSVKNMIGTKVMVEYSGGLSELYTVKSIASFVGEIWMIEFLEITNKNQASVLSNGIIKARRDLIGITDDEYLLNDLLEMKVLDENNNFIGNVVKIFDTSAHEILEVESDKYEVMIPNIEEFIKNIDFQNREIIVSLIEGMLEEKK